MRKSCEASLLEGGAVLCIDPFDDVLPVCGQPAVDSVERFDRVFNVCAKHYDLFTEEK